MGLREWLLRQISDEMSPEAERLATPVARVTEAAKPPAVRAQPIRIAPPPIRIAPPQPPPPRAPPALPPTPAPPTPAPAQPWADALDFGAAPIVEQATLSPAIPAAPPPQPAPLPQPTPPPPPPPKPARVSRIALRSWLHAMAFYFTCVVVYVGIVFCAGRLASIGIDARWDFWTYWQPAHYLGDIGNAFGQGKAVLGDAQHLAEKEHAEHPTAPAAVLFPTGPGLADPPFTLAGELQRWRALAPSYGLIYRGWVLHYERLQHEVRDDYVLDYPPLRLLVMTLWTWRAQCEFPGLAAFPTGRQRVVDARTHQRRVLSPDIAAPLLTFNMLCDAASAMLMFLLVWLWTNRTPRVAGSESNAPLVSWRTRWGDPLLVTPAILLGLMLLLRPLVGWDIVGMGVSDSLIDARISSMGWWLSVVLRFLAAVSLARLLPRPFRGPACGLVAGTLLWLNPAAILDSFGWPQWDCWIPPFFLAAALAVSLDCWMLAGIALGVGCMFKGQVLFVSPVLILAPLFAGWVRRFISAAAGVALGAALVVWPWLIQSGKAEAYVVGVGLAAALASWPAFIPKPSPRVRKKDAAPLDLPKEAPAESTLGGRWLFWIAWLVSSITAGALVMVVMLRQPVVLAVLTGGLALAVLVVPWRLRRRAVVGWVVLCFTAGVWIAGFSLGGNFSWWTVGFLYGTQKHQVMQLGVDALSNLSSILARRYHWELHDAVADVSLPWMQSSVVLDVQSVLAVVYGLSLLSCAAAAAVHLRRRDARFLVAITAPWVLSCRR
jgi:hypothetical protein